jgi:DNA-binding transcriptional regulator YiaG
VNTDRARIAAALGPFCKFNQTLKIQKMQEEKVPKIPLTARHLRAARGLLNWSAAELAEKAGITTNTIANWENGKHRPTQDTRNRVRDVLERHGVELLNGGRPGVRLSGITPDDDDVVAHHDDL